MMADWQFFMAMITLNACGALYARKVDDPVFGALLSLMAVLCIAGFVITVAR